MMISKLVECDYEILVDSDESSGKDAVRQREVLASLKQAEMAEWRYTSFPFWKFWVWGMIVGCAASSFLLNTTGAVEAFRLVNWDFCPVGLIPCAIVTLIMIIAKKHHLSSQRERLHINYQFKNKNEYYKGASALCRPFQILCQSKAIKSFEEVSGESNDVKAEESNFEKRPFYLFRGVSAYRKKADARDSEQQDAFCPEVPIASLKVAGIPKLYFLPDAVYAYYEGKNRWIVLSYTDVSLRNIRIIEFVHRQASSIPSDTTVIGSTWKHATQNGDRDMRFRDNVEYPKCAYGAFDLAVNLPELTASRTIVFSKTDTIESMGNAMVNYHKKLSD